MPIVNGILTLKRSPRIFREPFFLAEVFKKKSFDLYNFRITRLLAEKSEQMKMLCLSGIELYYRWVSLIEVA